jgi:hypothetical protein
VCTKDKLASRRWSASSNGNPHLEEFSGEKSSMSVARSIQAAALLHEKTEGEAARHDCSYM